MSVRAFRFVLAVLGGVLAAGAAQAAGTISASAQATVTVLSPLTLTPGQAMQFGTVIRASNGSPNTVYLDVNDTVTLTGSGNGSLVNSTRTSAKFNIAANAGTTYTTTEALTFTQTGLTNIGATLPAATTGVVGTVPAEGAQELRYGGHFDLPATAAAQLYSGMLTVTVNYN